MTGASIHVKKSHFDALVAAAQRAYNAGALIEAADLDELARRTKASLDVLPFRFAPKEVRAKLPKWQDLPSPLQAYVYAKSQAS